MGKDSLVAADIENVARVEAVPAILQAVTHTTGMRFAAVARVTDFSWTACAVHDNIGFGLQVGGELPLETTLCNEIRQTGQPVVFSQASIHPVFANHATPKLYGFESYISVPIVRHDGSLFGTLCALDPLPAKLDNPNVLRTLELFAQLIGAQLDAQERAELVGRELQYAQDMAKFREQFIAVLGHDLRNPLQAIGMATELLQLTPLDASAQRNIGRIQNSVKRMTDLVHDILDFARGRLGSGIPVALRRHEALSEELAQVVSETQINHPDRQVEAAIASHISVVCDARRIAQLLDNLLANAISHGDARVPVRVQAHCEGNHFILSVHNGGAAIPAKKMAHLFHPFSRMHSEEPRPGLGLGLYIAAEIAKAHLGTLSVLSDDASGTCFTFMMPRE